MSRLRTGRIFKTAKIDRNQRQTKMADFVPLFRPRFLGLSIRFPNRFTSPKCSRRQVKLVSAADFLKHLCDLFVDLGPKVRPSETRPQSLPCERFLSRDLKRYTEDSRAGYNHDGRYAHRESKRIRSPAAAAAGETRALGFNDP